MRQANFAYSQRGIDRLQAIKNKLNNDGYVSIIWSHIPKKHLKSIKELVKDCRVECVEEIEINCVITPKHFDYIK